MCTFCQSKRVSLAPLIWQWAWPLALSEDLFVQFVQKSEQEAEPHGHRLLTQLLWMNQELGFSASLPQPDWTRWRVILFHDCKTVLPFILNLGTCGRGFGLSLGVVAGSAPH